MDVLDFSQQTKQEADALLEHGNVLAILSKYGEVLVTGAYKHDLMYGPDIDITVVTDQPEVSAKKALDDFIADRNFRKYQLGDFIRFPLAGRPQGMIIVLIHEYQGRKWEIEIWFRTAVSTVDENFDTLLSTASEEQRQTILELKQQRDSKGLSKDTLESAAIYKGVLIDGKQSIEEF